jgi:phosphate transport system permease protein
MSVPTSGSPSVVAAPAGQSSVRRQMAAATGRIKRLKQVDRVAVGVITLGGLAVVVSVIGILVFIAAEAMPLFRAPTVTRVRSGSLSGAPALPTSAMAALGVDETRKYVYSVEPNGAVAFFAPETGARLFDRPVTSLSGAVVTASSRSLLNDFVALGTNDGRVGLVQVRFTPVHENGAVRDVTVDVADRGLVAIDPARRPVRRVAYLEEGERKFVAAQVSDADVALWWTDEAGAPRQEIVRAAGGGLVTAVGVGRTGTAFAGTDRGDILLWELGDTPVLTDTAKVGASPITSLGYVIGNHTLIAGTADGKVSAWFRAPVGTDGALELVRVWDFEPQRAAITGFGASTRDRTFATASADGQVVLRHQTSGRTLLTVPGTGAVTHLVMTPRSDGLLVVRASGQIDQFALVNPHPEISWRTLFGRVWYEDYAEPEYVWQSTAGTDDFEPKLSLVPLVFGTIKGTFYALIFAIPIAVFGALYTSQFVHPNLRARIKPTVEIMAALPSVVIGFIAGLYLAPMVERHLVGVLLLLVVLPLFGTSGFFIRSWLPDAARKRLRPGSELLVILPMLVLGAWLAVAVAPWVEGALFGGDARQWLSTALGLTYDQRNSLVVGLAMGFAIIPIIFTISEDAFSSVPATLSAASLALGASRWQTAVRVVIPTASPGVFSAIMIGFGRAVGETMIVLMATGNTPVLDWSLFNGFRTLSANIAVEIPEAPQGATLYRTLFLAASLLFLMTFTVNTIAEIIRQRLRERYRAV